ncbi:ATP-binding protein [Candidatus Kaiserbacteria bacterium]|nr:ATP-binding protein [Candidatus Kaiserbacteria bacterium]
MKVFTRALESRIREHLFGKDMIVIFGPRQAGKTTLAKKIIADYGDVSAYYDCQLADVRKHFIIGRPDELLPLTNKKRIVVFDEAQTIPDIGTILKVYHDTYPGVQIIATGSSSFDLANRIVEPMTGRAIEFTLLPLSINEIASAGPISRADLDVILLYGSYPRVVGAETVEQKEEAIKAIATNYLYKDIFVFEAIRNAKIFEDLVKALALQTGSLVSLHELAQTVGTTRATVNRYLRLLEQAFIVKRVHTFSNNPRTELKKAFKVFFFDGGVRNALVDIRTPLSERPDRGAIFENFVVGERMKQGTLETFSPEIMFWRTRAKKEIDIIEKRGRDIMAYECKWKRQDVSFSTFLDSYPEARAAVISPDDFVRE